VGVLRDAKPKRGARMRGRTGSCIIRQGVVKGRGRKIQGAERAYLLVVFFFFCNHAFIVSRYKNPHTALAMERTKPINQKHKHQKVTAPV